jgi:hypothetical protein
VVNTLPRSAMRFQIVGSRRTRFGGDTAEGLKMALTGPPGSPLIVEGGHWPQILARRDFGSVAIYSIGPARRKLSSALDLQADLWGSIPRWVPKKP